MKKKGNFYLDIAKVMSFLNVASLFFIFAIVVFYTLMEYAALPFIQQSQQFFSGGSFWQNAMIELFELLLIFPESLDTLFMAFIIIIIINIFYVAYKAQKGGWLNFFFFIVIGLPLWMFLSTKIIQIRDQIINYLTSTLVVYPTSIFFDYYTTYSIYVNAFIFIAAIIVNMVDWENVRERAVGFTQKPAAEGETLEEAFEQ